MLLPSTVTIGDAVVAEIADELNVKTLEPVTSLEGLLDYTVVPNFRSLGARLRDRMPTVKAALATVDGAQVQQALDRDGVFVLELDGGSVELGPADVEVRAQQHEELALAHDGAIAVALDLRLDDALRREGAARKLVRALNDHRKSSGLEIADRVRVELTAGGSVFDAVTEHREWIAGEVLAVDVSIAELTGSDDVTGYDPLEVDGTPVGVRMEKA